MLLDHEVRRPLPLGLLESLDVWTWVSLLLPLTSEDPK